MSINQAVIFTKPLHHLGFDLSPAQLEERTRTYFEQNGFRIVFSKKVTGSNLAEHHIIKQHYLIYSEAACASAISKLNITEKGKTKFEAAFGKHWDQEIALGKIIPPALLLTAKKISVHQLFKKWNAQFTAGKTVKLEDGLLIAYLADLNAYCINGFYPAMEANFNHPSTLIHYHVVEFDPSQVSWQQFRKKNLGSTDSSKADPASFRGLLYAEYPRKFPSRDNFVHGSAGPFEGFMERAIHEVDFEMASNPIGAYLKGRGVTLRSFADWKSKQSISALGELFDATEEKDTDDVLPILETMEW